MISSYKPKLGIYFSHYECLGHVSRVMAIAEVFKKRFPQGSLFFIQAGLKQKWTNVYKLGHVYQLPEALASRQYFKKSARISAASIKKRSDMCADILMREKPDLFITEFFPLGMNEYRYELIPSLIKLSSVGTKLWTVVGYPLLMDLNGDWRNKILELYQKIIILSPKSEKDAIARTFQSKDERRKYLDFFKDQAKRISFAGYLLPQNEVVKNDRNVNVLVPQPQNKAVFVTVVRGGGIYYPKIIVDAIKASELLGEKYYFTVIAGSATTTQEWDLFLTLAAKKKSQNLMLLRSAEDYEQLIKKSGICVAMAGYHTSVMLLKYQKKSIIIPFEGYQNHMSFGEQPARAQMLQKMLGSHVLSINELNPQQLTKIIILKAGQKHKTVRMARHLFAGEQLLGRAFSKFCK